MNFSQTYFNDQRVKIMVVSICLILNPMISVNAVAEETLLSIEKGFVEVPVVKGGARRGAVNIVMQGSGSDLLESISCDDGSVARAVIPDYIDNYRKIRDGDNIVIRSPGLSLEPRSGLGSVNMSYVDTGHLVFSGGVDKLINCQTIHCKSIECKFKFAKFEIVLVPLYEINNIEDLIKF